MRVFSSSFRDCLISPANRGTRAVGVEFVANPRVSHNTSGEVRIARAKRLVVVSGGAFGSPTILERSGIGAKAVLDKCGVEQLVDLPGVGENYQGHRMPGFSFICPH